MKIKNKRNDKMKNTNEILSQIQTTIANQFGRTIAINESKMSVSYSIAKAIIGNDENNNVIDAVKEG
jgi:ribosomal protein S25